jgi:hypothetical protein
MLVVAACHAQQQQHPTKATLSTRTAVEVINRAATLAAEVQLPVERHWLNDIGLSSSFWQFLSLLLDFRSAPSIQKQAIKQTFDRKY